MEAAGAEIARAALARWGRTGLRVLILAGPGQNGGDGLTAARHLDAQGARVTVCLLADAERLRGPALGQWRRLASAPDISVRPLRDCAGADFDLAIDAIFGTALRPPLAGEVLEALRWLKESRLPVLAVDLPTGVRADTGEALDGAARADLTLALGALKPGHVFWPGRGACGEVQLAGIGIPGGLYGDLRLDLQQDLPRVDLPGMEAPKQAYGQVLVLSGSRRYPGAAWLTARGALRGGAGRVVLASTDRVVQSAAALPEVIVQEVASTDRGTLDPRRLDPAMFSSAQAVAVGPGLDDPRPDVEAWRELLLALPVPLCIDADGLLVFAGDLESLGGRAAATVLTPHRGEAGRLIGRRVGETPLERLEAAVEIARRSGAVSLVKGSPTFIATPDGPVAVVAEGGPELAVPGSGDVLTGLMGAQLACMGDARTAAVRAALAHGRAGRSLGRGSRRRGHLASEIADALAEVLWEA